MRKSLLALFLVINGLGLCMAQGTDIEAEGRGITEYEASQQALMNLAKQLEVRVATYTGGAEVVEESANNMSNASAVMTDVLVTTDIVLSGVRYKTIAPAKRDDPFVVTAGISFAESRPLYVRRIVDLVQEATGLLAISTESMETDVREAYSREILSLTKEYRKYRTVAGIMGVPMVEIPAFPVALPEAQAKVVEAAKVVDSLDRGVKKIVQALAGLQAEGAKVAIAMPVLAGSSKSGTLAMALYNRLTAGLVGAGIIVYDDPAKARYLVKTVYTKPESDKAPLFLTVEVVSNSGKDAGVVTKVATVEIAGKAGAGYSYE